MSDFLEKQLSEVKGITYIIDIPIEEFSSITELEAFIVKAKSSNIGVALHYETSNFHCGVVAQIFDKKACSVKEYMINNL
jgi:hypothetical protein